MSETTPLVTASRDALVAALEATGLGIAGDYDRSGEELVADALLASGVVRAVDEALFVPRPHVPHGPKGVPVDRADADYLRSAARNIQHAKCLGSNLAATVVKLLNDTADAIATGGGR